MALLLQQQQPTHSHLPGQLVELVCEEEHESLGGQVAALLCLGSQGEVVLVIVLGCHLMMMMMMMMMTRMRTRMRIRMRMRIIMGSHLLVLEAGVRHEGAPVGLLLQGVEGEGPGPRVAVLVIGGYHL